MANIELSDREFSARYPGILDMLLFDRTSKHNLIFGTTNYLSKGFKETDYIDINTLTYSKKSLIRPRIEKSKIEQKKRSRDMGEVFTPAWICNNQNNLIDNEWFGYEGSFNVETGISWISSNKVKFLNHNWDEYIDLERLEITCGEAPYLTSRYDAVVGTEIEPHNRVGLFDRKMRVISENADNQEEFIRYGYIALKRIYGYDFQGDNVLLARKNIFLSYVEFYRAKYDEEPSLDVLKEVARIISYNIFQMDGIKYVIPYSCHKEEVLQLSLFDDMQDEANICYGCRTGNHKKHNGIYATIKDWRSNRVIRYVDMV